MQVRRNDPFLRVDFATPAPASFFNKAYFPTADANNNISVGAPRNARLTLTTAF